MFITKYEFDEIAKNDAYYNNRWGYINKVIEYSKNILLDIENPNIESTLIDTRLICVYKFIK